jgi:hypothetical protein
MCLTCGCGDAHLEMGDNITYQDLDRIAGANGNSVEETLRIMLETIKTDRAEHPHEYGISAEAAPGKSK